MYQLCHTHRRRRRPKVVGDDNERAWVIICATQLKQCDKFGRHNQHRNTFLRSERANKIPACRQSKSLFVTLELESIRSFQHMHGTPPFSTSPSPPLESCRQGCQISIFWNSWIIVKQILFHIKRSVLDGHKGSKKILKIVQKTIILYV